MSHLSSVCWKQGCLPVKRDAYSRIIPQHGDSGVDKGRSIDTANRIPSKPEDEKHHSSSKMILQLFPVDENIQMGLEKVNSSSEMTLC